MTERWGILGLHSVIEVLTIFPQAMITDVQLAIFVNVLGVTLFLLVVLYHYVAANNPKLKPE